MKQRLVIDVHSNRRHEIVGTIVFADDPLFTFEALVTLVEQFAATLDRPPLDVAGDLYRKVYTDHAPRTQ